MKQIDIYITEKLHLKKDNKDLVNGGDIKDFIESFKDEQTRNYILYLIARSIEVMRRGYIYTIDQKISADHKCYIVEEISGNHDNDDVQDKYAWDGNERKDEYEVGDIQKPRYSSLRWIVLFVVTKDTKIPAEYINDEIKSMVM